jgi:hypothetical protein
MWHVLLLHVLLLHSLLLHFMVQVIPGHLMGGNEAFLNWRLVVVALHVGVHWHVIVVRNVASVIYTNWVGDVVGHQLSSCFSNNCVNNSSNRVHSSLMLHASVALVLHELLVAVLHALVLHALVLHVLVLHALLVAVLHALLHALVLHALVLSALVLIIIVLIALVLVIIVLIALVLHVWVLIFSFVFGDHGSFDVANEA